MPCPRRSDLATPQTTGLAVHVDARVMHAEAVRSTTTLRKWIFKAFYGISAEEALTSNPREHRQA